VPRKLTEQQISIYWAHRNAGKSQKAAAAVAAFSLSGARLLEGRTKARNQARSASTEEQDAGLSGPIPFEKLSENAQRAWNDFPFFQEYYLGRIPLPWQEIAAMDIVARIVSPQEEYVVLNAPPGSGKTLLMTHDIPAWLTIRNRAIRGLMGAIVGHTATQYVNRLRRTLEWTRPIPGKPAEVAAGTAYDAKGCIAVDFGRFKPLSREVWTKEMFVVEQFDEGSILEKEATWTAFGFDQEFIGSRIDFMVWDDLVNPRKQRTIVAMEQLQNDWDDLVETRLEPRGVLALSGQRLSSSDLYRYNLDKRVPEVVDEATGEILESVPRYHHLLFPAHSDDRCQPEYHKRGAPAYPVGCLLAPKRLDWRKISYLKHQKHGERYEVVYQQKDVDPAHVLVPSAWVWGSGDFPGCVDRDRDRLELPRDREGRLLLPPPNFSAVSIDPSPSRYWGIEWWFYNAATEFRYLLDLERRRMEAPDLLSYNNGEYAGLLEEWWQTSKRLGVPFTHVIFEINAAARFVTQYNFFLNWFRTRNVLLIKHTTHANKSDPEYGVWTVRDLWRYGKINLPAKDSGLTISRRLIDEVTTYSTDTVPISTDCLMAHWFFEFQLPRLFHPEDEGVVQDQWRPSWLLDEGPAMYGRGY